MLADVMLTSADLHLPQTERTQKLEIDSEKKSPPIRAGFGLRCLLFIPRTPPHLFPLETLIKSRRQAAGKLAGVHPAPPPFFSDPATR